jgi:integrase
LEASSSVALVMVSGSRNTIKYDGILGNPNIRALTGGCVLNVTVIRKAKPKAAAYQMSDGLGLFLRVTPTGGKLWRWKYRHAGAQLEMSFGKYPDVDLVSARERHAVARKLLADGTDPMAQRKSERAKSMASDPNSFKTVADLWLDHWSAGKSARHVDTTRRRLEANTLPMLGSRPITEIEAPELVRMAKAIEKRGASDLAKRSLETTGQIFRFAVAHGYAKRNPAGDIKPGDVLKSTRKVNFARVDARDLPMLLRDIEVYRGHVVTRLAMKLLALTFTRTSELIGARWCEFDMEARRWNIPKERMKMRKPHLVPLSTQTIEVLELLRSITGGGELLFPGDRDQSKSMSNNTILVALKRMGYQGRQTGHGFRGIASTILHEQGYEHAHIELQLAHTQRNSVSASYNHALHLQGRARMMQAWADYLEQTQRGGKVLAFRAEKA